MEQETATKVRQEQLKRQILQARVDLGIASEKDLAELGVLNAPPSIKPDSGRIIGTPDIDNRPKKDQSVLKKVYTETLPD